MPEGAYTNELIVEVGSPLRDFWANQLVHGYIEDSATVPALAVLRFRDPGHLLLKETGAAVGKPLRLFAKTADEPRRVPLFFGEITALEKEIDGTGTFTTVRALDHSHRLFRGRRVMAYRNTTAADIARKVARRAGLKVGRIDPTRTVYDLVAQPNTTDAEFLRRLADENGAEMWVDNGKFFFCQPTKAATAPSVGTPARQSPYVLEHSVNLVSLRAVVTSAAQVDRVRVRGWDVITKRPLVATAPAAKSEELSLGVTPAQVAKPFGRAELLATDVPYGTQAEVDRAASALAADVTGAFAEVEAVVRDAPQLKAGTPVALTKVGQPFEGKYIVTSAQHVFEPGIGYRTQVVVSGRQDRSLYGLAAGASAPSRSARLTGLVPALVTDTKDPQQKGRVKLRFPWLDQDYVSDWVRTVQLGGVRGGGVFSPEVGDEVLVGFEQGYLDSPYVIGGLYNGKDKPSPHQGPLVHPTTGKVNRRSLVSRSGHRLELLDGAASGPQGVRLHTGNGKVEVHLDQRKTSVIVHSDGSVEIKAARQVTVTGRGVTVDAGAGELKLTGRSVAIQGRADCTIRAPRVRIN
jgi:phage protein D